MLSRRFVTAARLLKEKRSGGRVRRRAAEALEALGRVSPATNRAYPLTMVCETWRVARSSVYALRAQQGGPLTSDRRQPGKRGPKTALSDEELLQAGRALGHGRVAVLDEGGGLVLLLRGRRPLRLGCRRLARCEEGRPLGGAGAGPPGSAGPHGRLRQGDRPGPRSAARLGLAVQGKAQFQAEIKWLGIRSTPAYVGEPECNGVAKRFIRTLKEECIYLYHFESLEEARAVIGAFIERYNNGWLLQRHGYMTPARAREKLSRRAA